MHQHSQTHLKGDTKMKTHRKHTLQKGFFDLGVGFAILSVMGVTAIVTSPDKDNTEAELASCTKVATQQNGNGKCHAVDS